jgi:hypothetical protein
MAELILALTGHGSAAGRQVGFGGFPNLLDLCLKPMMRRRFKPSLSAFSGDIEGQGPGSKE